jgi:hypothetical protein
VCPSTVQHDLCSCQGLALIAPRGALSRRHPCAYLTARLQAGQRARFDNPPPELLLNRLPSMVAPCASCPGACTYGCAPPTDPAAANPAAPATAALVTPTTSALPAGATAAPPGCPPMAKTSTVLPPYAGAPEPGSVHRPTRRVRSSLGSVAATHHPSCSAATALGHASPGGAPVTTEWPWPGTEQGHPPSPCGLGPVGPPRGVGEAHPRAFPAVAAAAAPAQRGGGSRLPWPVQGKKGAGHHSHSSRARSHGKATTTVVTFLPCLRAAHGPRSSQRAAACAAAGPPAAPPVVAGAALYAAPGAAQHLAPSDNELAASGRCSAAPLHFTLAAQSSQPRPYGLGQLTPLPSACAAPPQCSAAALASAAHGCVARQEDEAVWREMHCQYGPALRCVDQVKV